METEGGVGRVTSLSQRLLLSSIDLRNIYILVDVYDEPIYEATPEPPIAQDHFTNQLAERVCLSSPIAWRTSLEETPLFQTTRMSSG